MKNRICAIIVAAVWAVLAVWAWLAPSRDISVAERRQLAQKPAIQGKKLLDGSFMADFEDASLDQFPLRDTFREAKSLFHRFVLRQSDKSGIYISQGYAAAQEYPLSEASVNHALERFSSVYETYLSSTDSQIYLAIVPDKGYYLAQSAGQLSMDYDRLFAMVEGGMPWASPIRLTDSLSIQDYYRTDTHWRQERLLPAAQVLCQALGVSSPRQEDYTVTPLENPFYGVYYGQAALPMQPDTMYLLESKLLDECRVYDYETGETTAVYDMTKLDSKDLYDVYLSGARSLLTIENPNAATDRELIVFRDSFGSSMVPLLVNDYAKVTLVDLRYIRSDYLGQFLDFHGQDVLFLYSTLLLNNSAAIK